MLAVYGVVAALLLRDAPGRTVPAGSFLTRTWATLRMRVTLQPSASTPSASAGSSPSASTCPTYLKNAYGLTQADAAQRTAGFVLLAVVMRPVGGWLSDRFHPAPVLTGCFGIAAALAVLAAAASADPARDDRVPRPWPRCSARSGACFALVARVAPAEKVGGVTGVVGAAGGLGGFVPPLVMGALYGATGATASACCCWLWSRWPPRRTPGWSCAATPAPSREGLP